jgi:hypothetical protein
MQLASHNKSCNATQSIIKQDKEANMSLTHQDARQCGLLCYLTIPSGNDQPWAGEKGLWGFFLCSMVYEFPLFFMVSFESYLKIYINLKNKIVNGMCTYSEYSLHPIYILKVLSPKYYYQRYNLILDDLDQQTMKFFLCCWGRDHGRQIMAATMRVRHE